MSASIKSHYLSGSEHNEPWTSSNGSVEQCDSLALDSSRPDTEAHTPGSLCSVNMAKKPIPLRSVKSPAVASKKLPGPQPQTNHIDKQESSLKENTGSQDSDSVATHEPWTRPNTHTITRLNEPNKHAPDHMENAHRLDSPSKDESTRKSSDQLFSGRNIAIMLIVMALVAFSGFQFNRYQEWQEQQVALQSDRELEALQKKYQESLLLLEQNKKNTQAALLAERVKHTRRLEGELSEKLKQQRTTLEAEQSLQLAEIRSKFDRKLSAQEISLLQKQQETMQELQAEKTALLEEQQRYQVFMAESAGREAELVAKHKARTAQLQEVETKMSTLWQAESENKRLRAELRELKEMHQRVVDQKPESESVTQEVGLISQTQPSDQSATGRSAEFIRNPPGNEGQREILFNDTTVSRPAPEIDKLFSKMEKGKLTYLQRYLINGGNPDSVNSEGEPLLIKATRLGYYIMVKELLRADPNIDKLDSQGSSALIHATIADNDGIANLLILHGANIHLVGRNGLAAIDIVTTGNSPKVEKLIANIGSGRNTAN